VVIKVAGDNCDEDRNRKNEVSQIWNRRKKDGEAA
jgi:hypothetical protein